MDFGTRLAEKRKEKGFTQDDLEKATGINKRLISRYEKNDTMPSIDKVFSRSAQQLPAPSNAQIPI